MLSFYMIFGVQNWYACTKIKMEDIQKKMQEKIFVTLR